jgi:hypothetical protein
MDKLVYHVWLTLLMGADNKKTDLLLQQFNSAQEIFRLTPKQLKFIEGLNSSDVDLLYNNRNLEDALNVIEECNKLG